MSIDTYEDKIMKQNNKKKKVEKEECNNSDEKNSLSSNFSISS